MITTIQIIFRLYVISVPSARQRLLKSRSDDISAIKICNQIDVADWFVLYQIGKNMDALIFREFLTRLNSRLKKTSAKKEYTDHVISNV